MDLEPLCIEMYQTTVASMQIPDELKRALRTHERMPRFLDNLVIELKISRSRGIDISDEEAKKIVDSMTRFFVQNVQRHADDRIMSEVAKGQIKREEQTKKEMRQLADAIFEESEANEQITRDKDGNETSRSTVKVSL